MSRIIGIDLGTTNSCVAVLDDQGNPYVLTTADGDRTTPSIVAFRDGAILTGAAAKRQAVMNPQATFYGAKRLVGRKVNTPDVTEFAKTVPFRIVAAPNGDAWLRVGDQSKAPQEIASYTLRRLKALAEEALNEPVTRAVVTVPAYFNESQRQATRHAGTIAGLDIVRILNEPTAAALAYGAHRAAVGGRRIIAVFDLGGGTFDISIMAVENGIFEVLATDGDMSLGGNDWDARMIERLADEIFDAHRIDVFDHPTALGRLKEQVEQAKRALSGRDQAAIDLPYFGGNDSASAIHYQRTLSRDEVDSWTETLTEKVRIPCERAMREAGITKPDIDEVLLVGGMTRSMAVQSMIEPIFGRRPSKGANPDEIVALGAAAYAGILSGHDDDATLLDVTPHDVGIKAGTSKFVVLIPRNSMLPVRATKLFATSRDNQKFVQIEVYQGDSDDIAKNRRLGQVTLDDLPPGRAGSIRVELTITIDVESLFSVSARELSTGKEAQVRIQPSGGLSQQEIIEIISKRREQLAPSDS